MSPRVRQKYTLWVNDSFCTGCGNCIEYCPQHVLDRDPELNRRGIHPPIVRDVDSCTGCQLCEMYCGNFAIAIGVDHAPAEVQ